MTHKIIFLDLPHTLIVGGKVSSAAIECLNRLTDGTGADLVLLPTWPYDIQFTDIRVALGEVGVSANILDCCPCVTVISKSGQVQMWLDKYRWTVAAFIVLSSDSEFEDEFGTHLVLVDDPAGLTPEIARKAARTIGL